MKGVFLRLLLALCLLVLGAKIYAAEKTETAPWDPSSAGPITTWTAPLCEKGEFVVQPFAFYNLTRGTFNSDGHYDALPEGNKQSQYQQQLFLYYGLTDRLEIDGQIIYEENLAKQETKAHSEGFADSYLYSRYCLWEEKGWTPHVTGLVQVKMPTGKYQHADPDKLETDVIGTGSWDPGVGLILTKKVKPFIFHADAICSFPQEVKVDGTKTQYASYQNYDFAVEYFLPRGFNLMFEINGFVQGDQKDDGVKTPASDVQSLTISPGIGWSNEIIQTLLAYQRTVLGTNTDANDSVVLMFVHTF